MQELTGVVKQDNLEAAFVANDHRFIFVPIQNLKFDSLPAEITLSQNYGTLHPVDNFFHGQTYDGRAIMIFYKKDLRLIPTAAFDTDLYILSDDNIPLNCYDVIEFQGGCLNSTFRPHSLSIGWDPSPQPKVEIHDDSIRVEIGTGDLKEILIGSDCQHEKSINGGHTLANTGAKLRLAFDQPQKIESTIIKRYADVNALVQFMTFRKNVWFDSIKLLKNESLDGETIPVTVASCYWKDEFQHEPIRDNVRCIRFDSLGAEVLAKLYNLIEKRNSKDEPFSVDFLPQSSKDICCVSRQQLKDVCTALEVEKSAQDIEPANSEPFKKLKQSIKKLIKESQRGEFPLTDREYSYINGNISHWNGPAAELNYSLYKQREDSIKPLLKDLGIEQLTEDDIQGVIRMRNDLAHTGTTSSNDLTAEKITILMGIIYSSVLSRCGCSDDKIYGFIEMGLLTT